MLQKIFNIVKESFSSEERDYTKGSLRLAIVLLAIPMVLELSLESLFAIVDIYFVGKISDEAIAVVGYTESVITLIYSVAIGLSTAATAIIARRVGEKNFVEASHSAAQAMMLAVFITLFTSMLGSFFAPDILRIMGGDESIVSLGTNFTRIMFSTSGVIIFLFLINGIFRGAGNASIAMKSLWLASIFNIVMDPIFIFGIGGWAGYGLAGAAIATVIGRGLGVLYQLRILFSGKSLIKISRKSFAPDFNEMKDIISIAWPATFQFLIASGSWIVLTKIVADTGGTSASAAYQIAVRNLVFFILPAWGLSNAAATLVGQNLGAKQIERAEKSVILSMKYCMYFMGIVSLFFLLFPAIIMEVFTKEAEVIAIGKICLRIFGAGFIFYGMGMVLVQALNGAGDTKKPTWINFIAFWCMEIPLAYLLAYVFDLGFVGVMISVPVSETFLALMAWYVFKQGGWKTVEV